MMSVNRLILRQLATACLLSAACLPACTPEPTLAPCHSGAICTFAGTGKQGFNGDGKPATESWLEWPIDLALDAKGTAVVADFNNYRIRRVNADGRFETIVGTNFPGDGDPGKLDMGDKGAPGTTSALNHPADLMFATVDSAVAKKGDLILGAWHNHRIRIWDPASGLVFAHCGAAPGFFGDGQQVGTTTKFNQPSKVTQDSAGNTYIIDTRNWRIRKVDAKGLVSSIAGNGKPGFDPAADKGALAAKATPFLFFDPNESSNPTNPGGGLATSADGATLYIADTMNHRIRAMDLAAGTVTTIAGSGTSGCVDLAQVATACAIDSIDPPSAGAFAGDGGPALQARLNQPHDLAWGPDGRLYFADSRNHRIRAIDMKTGIIQTVAGNGKPDGDLGDGGEPLKASLNEPWGIAFDPAGNLFIADTYHNRIRKITK